MTKDFQKMNIPKLPVFTTEDGIKTIREFFGKLFEWKKLDELIPGNFKSGSKYKKTGKALPVFLYFEPLLKLPGINSSNFFHSNSLPKNSLIVLIPSSVVNTGSFGIFIF